MDEPKPDVQGKKILAIDYGTKTTGLAIHAPGDQVQRDSRTGARHRAPERRGRVPAGRLGRFGRRISSGPLAAGSTRKPSRRAVRSAST